MRTLAEGLAAVRDYTLVYETDFLRFADRPPLSDEERAKVPPVEHPLVRVHPQSGRRARERRPPGSRPTPWRRWPAACW